jgi:hypothetical protein
MENRTIIINISGVSKSDQEEALDEAIRKIKEGYLSGFDSNDTGGYNFQAIEGPLKPKDEQVIHVWEPDCEECEDNEAVEVNPDFYQKNGEPSCVECGRVFRYSHTEVEL